MGVTGIDGLILASILTETRVSFRISKIMPVQNSNSKISVRPDLATYIPQILIIPTIFDSLLCPEGQSTHQPCPRRWFFYKIFGYYAQKIEIHHSSVYLAKKEVFRKLPVQKTGSTGSD